MTKKLEGCKMVSSGIKIVSFCVFRDELYVASETEVYRLEHNQLIPLRISERYCRDCGRPIKPTCDNKCFDCYIEAYKKNLKEKS